MCVCKQSYWIQCNLKCLLILCGWLCVCTKTFVLLPFLYVFPSHTEESVSGTADNEGEEPAPETVSHFFIDSIACNQERIMNYKKKG